MYSITYSQFKESPLLKGFNPLITDDCSCPNCVNESFDEIDEAYEAGSVLHDFYCNDPTCQFEEEEESLPDPWCGADHYKWLEVWEDFKKSGIRLDEAVSFYNEVMLLAGSTPTH